MRRSLLAPVAAVALLAGLAPGVFADTGPATQDTLIARGPFTIHGSDGRTYTGEFFVQRDLLGASTVAGFYFTWRNLVTCDNGTPEPDDDFIGEEAIDFTVDSITPSAFTIASNLSSASGTLTKSGHRIHTAACDGSTIEDVVESHTLSFSLAATGPAKKTMTRERIDNGDGTITTVVVKEAHRPAAGSVTLDVAGTIDPATGADLAHVEVTQTTR